MHIQFKINHTYPEQRHRIQLVLKNQQLVTYTWVKTIHLNRSF